MIYDHWSLCYISDDIWWFMTTLHDFHQIWWYMMGYTRYMVSHVSPSFLHKRVMIHNGLHVDGATKQLSTDSNKRLDSGDQNICFSTQIIVNTFFFKNIYIYICSYFRIYVYMCICVYVFMCMCVYIYMCIYMYIYISIYECKYVYVNMYMYICKQMRVYILYIYVWICI